MIMIICIKQHLSNIWSSIHENLSNFEAELKKSVAYKKSVCKKHQITLSWQRSLPYKNQSIGLLYKSLLPVAFRYPVTTILYNVNMKYAHQTFPKNH